MLKLEALVEKLQAHIPQSAVGAVRQPVDPDRTTTLTEFGGQTTLLEDAVDVPHVQVMCRSTRLDNVQARDDAHQVDAFFMDDTIRPYMLGGYLVLSSGRSGGGPGFLKSDDQNRTTYVCNYWLQIQR